MSEIPDRGRWKHDGVRVIPVEKPQTVLRVDPIRRDPAART